ncbi:MAG TPA: hypothetical protein VEH28_01495, partial [Thermoplasmata archaeon]|nr:hypothetical protein [Thermoplasmata archaeon]
MNASRRWWSVGIIAVAVIAVFILSMVVPVSTVVSARGGSSAAAPASSKTMATTTANARTDVHPSAGGGPHPGTLEIYEVAPQGQSSEDPAVAYDTVSAEAVWNVYQTLIAYNGSSTADFVPELSTCVPGLANGAQSTPSVSCQAVYGNSLIVNGPSGAPEYFTYPIDPHAHFYDGATGVSWPVYPSDVMFALARSTGFADLPGPGVLNGWIQAQSLLPIGNVSWDSHLHYPFNSTPQNVLGSMLINDSTYCPASALAANGCITFNASGEGVSWPFFNQLVADPMGAGVAPCGWFTAQSAGVPGFTGSKVANGDGPCLLPGGATNTSQAAFTNFLATEPYKAWDTFEQLALNHPAVQPGVQFNLVGSGPYYIAPGQDVPTVGYTLQANPGYQEPTGCVGVGGGCEPAPGAYIAKVVVQYEPDDVEGIQQYLAGQSDYSQILPSETATYLQLIADGKITPVRYGTISTFFLPYNFDFNMTGAMALGTDHGNLNVPSDFFASNTVRNFLDRAWPYTTINDTLQTTDGVSYGFNFGGAIPVGMGDYYPTNISWPYIGGDPTGNTSVGSANWWWTEGTTPGNPYYDPELAACTPTSPCKFPLIGQLAAPLLDSSIALWISSVEGITHNALQPFSFDLSFPDLVEYSGMAPGDNPMPFFNLGWAPDYPDPTDYMAAMYYANGTYTLGDATYQTMEMNASYNAAVCGHTADTWADLVYWANFPTSNGSGPALPWDCQGPAYGQMLYWMGVASSLPVGDYRILVYNEVEHIENQIGMYLWQEQANDVQSVAPWINPTLYDTNVMIGGGNDQLWYLWGYLSAVTSVTFSETGLASGTTWSVTYAGTTYTNTSSSIVVPFQTNGTYPYEIGYVPGYTITTGLANGSVHVVVPTASTVSVTFTGFTGGAAVNFQEVGLKSGTTWTVTVAGVGAITGNATLASFTLPTSGSPYTYAVATAVGYTATPATGTAATGTTTMIVFTGVLVATFPLTIVSYGLEGASWTATVNSYTNSSVGSITFWEPNGSYPIVVSSTTTLTPEIQTNPAVVNGVAQTIFVAWVVSVVPQTYAVTFTASAGFTGAWSVSFNGVTNSSATGAAIGFVAKNGTFTYAVTVPSGMVATPAGGQGLVNGAAVAVSIGVSTS